MFFCDINFQVFKNLPKVLCSDSVTIVVFFNLEALFERVETVLELVAYFCLKLPLLGGVCENEIRAKLLLSELYNSFLSC